MNDILDLVQTTLDTLLASDNVFTFWGRRADISATGPTPEYVIYAIESDDAEVSADGGLMYRMMTVWVQYYIKYSLARTAAGRKKATDRMDAIREALRAAGFGCSGGWSEIGDIDDVGFATFRATFSIPRLMEAA